MNVDAKFVEAIYRPNPIEAFVGNPLIEALPPIRSNDEWVKALFVMPALKNEVRRLSPEQRLVALVDLERFNYPLPEYIELARRIESAIYRGYSTKNPCLSTSNHFLHYLDPDETMVQPLSGRFEARPTGITLVGPSGSGKTRMFESILAQFPQIIQHKTYQGRTMPITQVVWLKVDCPEDQSLVTFAGRFLSALDNAVGTNLFEEAFNARNNKGVVIEKVIRQARNYRVGLIVLDEFSNLKLPKKATAENVPLLLKLILNLMNGSGVPSIFCGNPEMLDTIQLTLKTARRAENGGVIVMGTMLHAVWNALSKWLWPLQVTSHVTPWNEELTMVLYEASRGLVEIAVRGFFEAQRLVIGSGDERLTSVAIQSGVMNAIQLSNKTLDWSVKQNVISRKWAPVTTAKAAAANPPMSEGAADLRIHEGRGKRVVSGLHDPLRVQHSEFSNILERLRYETSLIPAKTQLNILRDTGGETGVMQKLIERGIVLEDAINLNPSEMSHDRAGSTWLPQ